MTPDDERHGTYAGAVAHWFDGERPCETCAREEGRYRKLRKLDALRGIPRRVPALGTLRRIQALHALGWTGPQVAEASGLSIATTRSIQHHQSETILVATADAIAACYDRLSMRRPEGGYAHRQRLMAARKGWVPPLAWDDIDRDPEPPTHETSDDVDHVLVDRILAGEFRLRSTPAEKAEAVRRWVDSGRSLRSLRNASGWKVERYLNREESAA